MLEWENQGNMKKLFGINDDLGKADLE